MEERNEINKTVDFFNEYDSSVPIAETCTEEHLKFYSKNSKKTPAKLKAFNRVLYKIESDLNKYLVGTKLSISGLKFKNTFSAGEKNRSVITKVMLNKSVNGKSTVVEVNLNVNVNKLLKFPALEVYSIVSALVYNSFGLNKSELESLKSSEDDKSNETFSFQNTADLTKEKNSQIQYESSKWLIQVYIKDFLPRVFGDRANVFNLGKISELIAEQLLSNMSESEIAQVSSLFFKMERIDDKAIREARKYFGSENDNSYLFDIAENLYSARTAKLQEKSRDLALIEDLDYYKNAKTLSSQEQFIALSATFAGKNEKVRDALEGGFNNDNIKLQDFCTEYANSFMASNKLKPIEIRFKDSGVCKFREVDGAQFIEINLSAKELRNGSIAELVMTLSHELTHAVDASINKINGKFNKYGGGLENTMNGNLKDCDYPNAMNLLKKIQAHCYRMDPNERHARIGELSALKFLKNIYGDNPVMREQMEISIKGSANYQIGTIECAKGLNSAIAEFERQRDELVANGMPETSKAYAMIEERIDYLKNANLDDTLERQSIEDIYDILKQKSEKQTAENILEQYTQNY